MSSIVTSIMQILVSGITTLGQGIASGISDTVSALFIVEGTGGTKSLSTLGEIIAVFAAIGLAIGLTRLAVHWVMSLGGGNNF